jgi:hypothetical protein
MDSNQGGFDGLRLIHKVVRMRISYSGHRARFDRIGQDYAEFFGVKSDRLRQQVGIIRRSA